jgi:hypothetical protein
MTLNRIDPNSLVSQTGLERFQEAQRRDGSDQKKDNALTPPAGGGRVEQQDRAEISDTARRLMEIRQTVESGRDAMAVLPEVRDSKLAEARERLAKGYYHSAEVTNDVAEKLNKTFDAIDGL